MDAVLKGFQERMQQYKFLEMQLTQRKASLMHKLPEIKKTLDLVRMLKEKADEGEVSSRKSLSHFQPPCSPRHATALSGCGTDAMPPPPPPAHPVDL